LKRATIYQIAAVCGVSAATVSRAFSRPDLVNETVRHRITAVAEQLQYRPNRAAKGLANGRVSTLGLLVPDITNPFIPLLVRAVQQAADGLGYSMLLTDAESDAALEPTLIGSLIGQIDGLILASPRAPSSVLRRAAGNVPCVVINRVIRELPSVVCDNNTALEQAGNLLTDLGHRRIALLCGPTASWAARRRAQAVEAWAGRAGVSLRRLGPFDASFEGGRVAGASLLRSRVTAAYAFDDVMAAGVLAELAARGVRVPDEQSIVGCDDVLLASMITPGLTTITAPVIEIGQAAVKLMDGLVHGVAPQTQIIRLNGSLVVRASTAPAPLPR
jgi:DNA-binding LacI/PurR family transcriptional regulator